MKPHRNKGSRRRQKLSQSKYPVVPVTWRGRLFGERSPCGGHLVHGRGASSSGPTGSPTRAASSPHRPTRFHAPARRPRSPPGVQRCDRITVRCTRQLASDTPYTSAHTLYMCARSPAERGTPSDQRRRTQTPDSQAAQSTERQATQRQAVEQQTTERQATQRWAVADGTAGRRTEPPAGRRPAAGRNRGRASSHQSDPQPHRALAAAPQPAGEKAEPSDDAVLARQQVAVALGVPRPEDLGTPGNLIA